ncbi:ankyrin repeat domain-containing protein [Pseudomonas helleri]|uniref:ankyrin repeat domain-containing protein n=1 Tax=Pseudomonas helleri TaxID=1608996 RepID=UPI00380AD20E
MRIFALAAMLLLSGWALADQPDTQTQLKGYYFDAARRGDVVMLDTFIDSHFDLDAQDSKGYTALILAAYNGHDEAVEHLLKAGANACAQDLRGNTALMGAIFKGEFKIARRLMNTDCNPDQRNGAGQTAAMFAGLFKRVELLNDLSQKGADLNAKDAQGNTAAQLIKGEIRMPESH